MDVESIPGLGGERGPSGTSAPTADYAVQAWLDARAAFDIIDQWRAALLKGKTEPKLLERVRLDGRDLCALYQRRQGPAADLVAEELGWRLEEEDV